MQGHELEKNQTKTQTQNVKKNNSVEGAGKGKMSEHTQRTSVMTGGKHAIKPTRKIIEGPRKIVHPQVRAYTHK